MLLSLGHSRHGIVPVGKRSANLRRRSAVVLDAGAIGEHDPLCNRIEIDNLTQKHAGIFLPLNTPRSGAAISPGDREPVATCTAAL